MKCQMCKKHLDEVEENATERLVEFDGDKIFQILRKKYGLEAR